MAVDMFIKIGDIKGEAKDATYKDWIEVLSWSWGLSQAGSMALGRGGGSGKVNVQDLSITKYVDTASTNLFIKCCNGKHYPEASLVVRKAGGDKPVEYTKIIMTNVMVSSISNGGNSGGDLVTENVGLNFSRFEIKYTPQDESGATMPEMAILWDLKTNTGG